MTTKKKNLAIFGAAALGFSALGWLISNTNTVIDLRSKYHENNAQVIVRIIAGQTQRLDADELVVRISNSTNRQESLTEPTFECEKSEGTKQLIYVWNDLPVPMSSPTFPPHELFPINLPAGGTVEATLFVRKILGLTGIRDCKKLRFSWIDGAQDRKFGDVVPLAANTAMFSISGPRVR